MTAAMTREELRRPATNQQAGGSKRPADQDLLSGLLIAIATG